MILSTLVLLLTLNQWWHETTAFSPRFGIIPRQSQHGTSLAASNNDNDNKNVFDDDNIFDNGDSNDKLGIDIGKMLEPLSREEAEELRAQASELISDKVAQGVDDIQALRAQLQKELEQQSKERLLKSEMAAKQASLDLMKKIDSITSDFMKETETLRKSTKLAAAADQASEGKGVELGSWGSIGGASVTTGFVLGSVASSSSAVVEKQDTTTSSTVASGEDEATPEQADKENRILIIADPSQDSLAKALLPAFEDEMQKAIDGIVVETLKPTQTMPLGGDNAQCVLIFAPSINDASSVRKIMDRLLRRTLQGDGKMASPPTQLVCVSSIGTSRTNKMPYSLQNLMGGKLDKQRQVEEALVNTVKQRVTQPPLDYTILKFGESKSVGGNDFELEPGDSLDGSTSVELAASVLTQAIAFQPFARNATLSVVGDLPDSISEQVWDEAFVKLDGPELLRISENLGDVSYFDQLNEYLGEWALLMESGKRKLATPIRVAPSIKQSSLSREGVKERKGWRLLFLPTNTGAAYLSKSEERAREEQSGSSSSSPKRQRRNKPEGGVEVLVEITDDDELRVRARRCNMADDTVLKEISEEKILKRLKDSLEVWTKDIVSSKGSS